MLSRLKRFLLPGLLVLGSLIFFLGLEHLPKAGDGAAAVSGSGAAGSGAAGPATRGFPSDIIDALHDCLDIKEELEPDVVDQPDSPRVRIVSLDEALAEIEKNLGPPMTQGDLWTNWILRLPEGLDRRIHLELIETPSGQLQQNLSVFQMDQSGKATRVQMPDEEEKNPPLSVITGLLDAGEVLRKETSRFYEYSHGERLEVVESDGRTAEIEVVKGETFFRCDEMKSPENCTCIR